MLYNKSEYIETVRGAVCGSGWRGWAGMGSGLDWTGLGSVTASSPRRRLAIR